MYVSIYMCVCVLCICVYIRLYINIYIYVYAGMCSEIFECWADFCGSLIHILGKGSNGWGGVHRLFGKYLLSWQWCYLYHILELTSGPNTHPYFSNIKIC